MRKLLMGTTALLLSVAPAQAQLLGGGAGGGLGGAIGGTLNGAGSIGSSVDSVTSTTRGTLRGSGSTRGGQSVDRKAGRVQASRNAEVAKGGDISQTVTTPARSLTAGGSGGASAAGSGSLDAQLIGTDAVRGNIQSLRGTAGGAVDGASELTGGLTGTLSGSGSAAGAGSAGPLSGSGSANADSEGALAGQQDGEGSGAANAQQ